MEGRAEELTGPASPRHPTRREVLKALGALLAALPGAGLVYRSVFGLVTARGREFSGELMRPVVDLAGPMRLFAGSTNRLRAAQGRGDGLSPYLTYAAEQWDRVIQASGAAEVATVDADHDDLVFEPGVQALVLGGPLANDLTAGIYGYRWVGPPTGPGAGVPLFEGDLPFAFHVGDASHGYGSFGHGPEYARRADGGELKEMFRYGIIRGRGSDPEPLPVDADGLLTEDVLLVLRAASAANDGATVTIIGGAHGYSSMAFAADVERNVVRLGREVAGLASYQALIPVVLEHRSTGGLWQTVGTLDWDRLEVVGLS